VDYFYEDKEGSHGFCKSPSEEVFQLRLEDRVNSLRLGLFSRLGCTREVEELGKKREVELIDIRKIGL